MAEALTEHQETVALPMHLLPLAVSPLANLHEDLMQARYNVSCTSRATATLLTFVKGFVETDPPWPVLMASR